MIAAVLLATAFLLFGLATDRHHERRFGRRPDPRFVRRCRAAAWTLVGVALAAAVSARGWVFGPVAWAGLAMAGAAVSFLALNLLPAPERARR